MHYASPNPDHSVLAQNTTENGIKFFKIPSALRGIPESPPWEVHVDYKIRDFGMDPGANLLILLEVVPTDQATPHRNSSHIHLVTMSDGAPHPEARCPELKIAIEHYTQHWTYTIQTHGDYLGILYAPSPHVRSQSTYQLAIWNWRLGLVLARMSGNDIESFAFLDSRRFIVARIPPFEDQDVEFDDMQPYLELYSFVDVLDQPMPEQIPRILGILRYPTTGTGISSFDLTIRTDPASTWNPPESPSVPFHIANKNRIFIIQFYLDTVPHPRPIMHCIHISTLLELANRLEVESLQVQQDEIIDVPWEDWGPHGSRMWIDQVVSRNWVCYVYGSRWISFRIVRSKGGQPSLRITLRDFSTLGVRHGALMKQLAASTGTESHKSPAMDPRDVFTPPLGDKWTYHVNQDTTIDEEADLFADAISTSLPYREVSESLPPEIYSGGRVGVMMSEDAILLVEVRDTVEFRYSS